MKTITDNIPRPQNFPPEGQFPGKAPTNAKISS